MCFVNCFQCLFLQLKGLTDNLKSRDEVVGELQKQHEEQLSRLTQLAKDRDCAWTKQKEEMEQHYAQLLSDLQSRTKVGGSGGGGVQVRGAALRPALVRPAVTHQGGWGGGGLHREREQHYAQLLPVCMKNFLFLAENLPF